uniref:Gasdermin pore forming domain-containing protein n=1 Tax=Pelusios castaneus TaxID=367368 RepID=A0A8C8S8N4_9SAUR
MFHKITKDLTKRLAPDGDLLPVCSFIDQAHFRPLYLVRRKQKNPFWMTHRYYKTGFMIQHILEPGEERKYLDVQDSGFLTVLDCVDDRVEGHIKLPDGPGILEVRGAASMQQVKSVKVKTVQVNPADFEFLKEKRKINMNHSLIKQLRKRRENLYVITEAVQTSEETRLYESIAMEGNIQNEICVDLSLKGIRTSKKGTVLPKDCVLAFRVMPLIIEDESWGISYHPDDKTFVSDGKKHILQSPFVLILSLKHAFS